MTFERAEKYRSADPLGRTQNRGDKFGFFVVKRLGQPDLKIVASSASCDPSFKTNWNHVSVSTSKRCPTWEEMCFVKSLFWDDEETVLQFHPPKSQYVNNHPYCLHLWENATQEIELPPNLLVGIKGRDL